MMMRDDYDDDRRMMTIMMMTMMTMITMTKATGAWTVMK